MTVGQSTNYSPDEVKVIVQMAVNVAYERAAKVEDGWATSQSCAAHDVDPCCHIRTGAGIAAAIRKLKEGGE